MRQCMTTIKFFLSRFAEEAASRAILGMAKGGMSASGLLVDVLLTVVQVTMMTIL